MAGKKHLNVFTKITDAITAFDDVIGFDASDTLSGKFAIKRRMNRQGVSSVRAIFAFKDQVLSGFGPAKKVKFKDKITNSLFGDSVNPRVVKSGNKKYDYLDAGKKIVELSVEPEYLKAFETGKKLSGFFRVSFDDSFIALSTGQKENFQDNKILTADFEFNLL